MTYVITQPDVMAAAATDIAEIRSAIAAANAAAAPPTTDVLAAAADEVSAASATLFNTYAQEYQAVIGQASAFHEAFVAALAAAGNAYAEAEAAAKWLLGGTAAPSPLVGTDPMLPSLTLPTVGLFMGPSSLPIPTTQPGYMAGVLNWVNYSGIPNLTLGQALPLFTPEGFYPLTGVKNLPLSTSVSQGVTILESAINQQITSGNSVAVLDYSQSAIISSVVMQNIMNGTYPFPTPPTNQLNFTLIGNPMAPNGGIFERFVGLSLPSLGLNFLGATPPNTPYGTSIYTLEYDGIADFPQYPINFVSDLNAFAGMVFLHSSYPSINPATLPPGDHIIELPGSASLPGGTGATNYYMVTQPNLPLLDLLRAIPVIGNPIADLVQPDLTVLVNLGYGSTTQGWSTGPANAPTPFGVIPPVTPGQIISALAAGTPQGFSAFMNDVNAEAPVLAHNLTSLGSAATSGASSLPAALTAAQLSPTSIIQSLQTANTNVADFISNAVAQSYAVLLPTADIVNALVTSIPSYDVNLFLSGIAQAINGDPTGGLIYAFGAPLAANTGLFTVGGGIELLVLLNAVGATA